MEDDGIFTPRGDAASDAGDSEDEVKVRSVQQDSRELNHRYLIESQQVLRDLAARF